MMNSPIVPEAKYEQHVLGWMMDAVQEADSFVKAQDGYDRIEPCLKSIMGTDKPLKPKGLSTVTSNELGRAFAVLAADLTDIKPFWDVRTINPKYEDHARNGKKLSEAWFLGQQIDQKFNIAIKYALVAGSGFLHMVWNPDTQDLDAIPVDPRDVLPIRPSSNYTIQDALGVVIRNERSVNYVRSRFPHKATYIKADRDGSASALVGGKTVSKMMQFIKRSPLDIARSMGKAVSNMPGGMPVVDLYHAYIRDDSVNETSSPVEVGDFEDGPDGGRRALNNWSYVVQPGDPLYPGKRMIIFTKSCVIYDGPNIYWHGMFPVSKLTLDPIPGSWLGKAPMWDAQPLQDSLDEALRAIDDHMKKVLRPPVWGDKTSIAESELRKIDPRREGQRWRSNPAGKGVNIVEIPPLDPIFQWAVEYYTDRINALTGVQDISSMMGMGQVPEGETIDKIVQAMTPAVRARSRSLELFMREFGMMFMHNAAQWYTIKRRLQILGPTGLTVEDFDFDPDSLIPAFVESDYGPEGTLKPERYNNPRPRRDRAREHMRQFSIQIAPGSLLNSSETKDKLMYLQLARMNFIDLWTLHEKLGIPNMGEAPPGTIPERLAAYAQMMAPPPMPGGPEGGPSGGSTPGPKPTAQQNPQLKSSGAISESG